MMIRVRHFLLLGLGVGTLLLLALLVPGAIVLEIVDYRLQVGHQAGRGVGGE